MAAAGEGATTEPRGSVRRALRLRAKYRVQREKQTIPLDLLGVHPGNSAGMYPQDETATNLGFGLLLSGLLVDEANHEGVRVQEIPAEEQGAALHQRTGPYGKCLGVMKHM